MSISPKHHLELKRKDSRLIQPIFPRKNPTPGRKALGSVHSRRPPLALLRLGGSAPRRETSNRPEDPGAPSGLGPPGGIKDLQFHSELHHKIQVASSIMSFGISEKQTGHRLSNTKVT